LKPGCSESSIRNAGDSPDSHDLTSGPVAIPTGTNGNLTSGNRARTPPGTTMIRVDGLHKRFGQTVAVDDVSLRVETGETFGLLGPNGAGKSTTLQLMMGILTPDRGSVTFADNRNPRELTTRHKLGFAPQQLSLYEALTGWENLRFFSRMYGLYGEQQQRQMNWALEMTGLLDRAKDPVKTYSGGMKRRLNLALAVVHDPPLILLDEPTVGVDPQSRHHLFENIEQLQNKGRTIVYTTHYMEAAQRLCDRIAIIDQGRVLALDTVDALVTRYGGSSQVSVELVEAAPTPTVLPERLSVKQCGHALQWETETPLAELELLSAAAISVRSVEITRPNLETVFLNLTGRKLRD